MRSLLLVLVPLLAGGAVYWFVSSGGAPAAGGGEEELTAGAGGPPTEMKAEETFLVDRTGARIAESFPEDILDAEKAESAIYEQPEMMEARVEIASAVEGLSGDLILRSIARILGPARPFHFKDAATLEEFKRKTFEGIPSGQASLAELMSYLPRAGFAFFQRDKRIYVVRLPEPEED